MTTDSTPGVVDVSIVMVTFDSEQDLRVSLESALAQDGVTIEVVVVDNASTDSTAAIVGAFGESVRFVRQRENVGFAQGMNVGIGSTTGRYVLALNPDCRLESDYCAELVKHLDAHPEAASASGRLLRGDGPDLAGTDVIDSTGIYFTRSGRHFDRGAGESASDRYAEADEVFGVTGAAGFYRRLALESAYVSTGYFDADFFAYREDADLAWRLQHLGWTCPYVPTAVAVHRRGNLPERRAQMSVLINYHSVKNRWLLRINNQTRAEFVRDFFPTLFRDCVVVGGVLIRERSSLPAFTWLWSNRRRLVAKRREIQALPKRSTTK